MTDYRAPLDDIRFVLKQQLKLPESWANFEGMEGVDDGTLDAVLAEAAKVCEEQVAPLNREADEKGCVFFGGEVATPKGFKEAYDVFCEGGWGALGGNPEYGGMGLPKGLVSAIDEMLQGSNMAFGLAPMLTAGACLAIDAHGSEALKQTYLAKMYSGEWSGAMCLTEPHAGTDLGMIRTKAEDRGDGSYSISGTKIFITWGEHDMTKNIVHLVLAKLPDAPPGVKGISMFLVPKILPDGDGLGEANGVSCGSLEKKMGIKASPTCVMNFDGAQGWLVGPLNKGLQAMFTMMNYERLVVGVQAVGAAQHSYQNAVDYAKERLQSRSISGVKSPDKPADPIIVHPDVKRMLLSMRSYVEGGRAFYMYVANFLDIAKYSQDEGSKALAEKRIALLTPVAKAFLSDTSFEAAVMGQQVYGGHGYIREWGQEQLVRDIRITQIYEGTNGIQALDLVGRKTVGTQGALCESFCQEIEAFIAESGACEALGEKLRAAVSVLREATEAILKQAESLPEAPAAGAVDYLNLLGHVAFGYMWYKAAVAVEHGLAAGADLSNNMAQAKSLTAVYYFDRILPIIEAYKCRVNEAGASISGVDEALF